MFSFLETKLGRFAIPHLIPGIVFLCTITFVLLQIQPEFINYLIFDPKLILQGQVWRLFTYAFIPPDTHPIFIIFALLFFWNIGNGLEQAWGSFQLNLYYFIGLFTTALIAFLFNWVDATGLFLSISLLLAFATFYPNYEILLFFILPLKIKWIAFLALFPILVTFFLASTVGKIAILSGFLNYFLFFGKDLIKNLFQKRALYLHRKTFQEKQISTSDAFHHCVICQKNEISSPHLTFRVAADGQEYCQEHLPKPAPK